MSETTEDNYASSFDAETPIKMQPINLEVRKLSTVSKKYDRGNKGYLDETEMTLRQMDSKNLGYLDIDKVYTLMQNLEKEQRKAINLKKVVIALSIFAVLLALANIGTSFAAATLAKDTEVNTYTGDLNSKLTGLRLGTTSKVSVIQIGVESSNGASPRRELVQGNNITLVNNGTTDDDSFTITYEKADELFVRLCGGNWPGIANWNNETTIQCDAQEPSVPVQHCGFQTDLKFSMSPIMKNDSKITFKYEGCRGSWCGQKVRVVCDDTTSEYANSTCSVKGLNCDQACSVCNTNGGYTFWWCEASEECGCYPGGNQCVQEELFCSAVCYNGI